MNRGQPPSPAGQPLGRACAVQGSEKGSGGGRTFASRGLSLPTELHSPVPWGSEEQSYSSADVLQPMASSNRWRDIGIGTGTHAPMTSPTTPDLPRFPMARPNTSDMNDLVGSLPPGLTRSVPKQSEESVASNASESRKGPSLRRISQPNEPATSTEPPLTLRGPTRSKASTKNVGSPTGVAETVALTPPQR